MKRFLLTNSLFIQLQLKDFKYKLRFRVERVGYVTHVCINGNFVGLFLGGVYSR